MEFSLAKLRLLKQGWLWGCRFQRIAAEFSQGVPLWLVGPGLRWGRFPPRCRGAFVEGRWSRQPTCTRWSQVPPEMSGGLR